MDRGLGWRIASLFLGPIATFVLVVSRDKLPEPSGRSGEVELTTDTE